MRLFLLSLLAAAAAVPAASAAEVKTVLAGGCFWSMEKAFDQAPGVIKTVSGYAGGTVPDPTYHTYNDGDHPHVEAVEVTYDDTRISYEQLVEYYFRHIDPTSGRGQFCDFGPGYRPVIFTASADERATAERVKAAVARELDEDVEVAIRDAGAFHPAEGAHQDYYLKNAAAYDNYARRCGRAEKLKAIWKTE